MVNLHVDYSYMQSNEQCNGFTGFKRYGTQCVSVCVRVHIFLHGEIVYAIFQPFVQRSSRFILLLLLNETKCHDRNEKQK